MALILHQILEQREHMKIGVIVDNDLNDDVRVKRETKLLRDSGFDMGVLCFAFDGKTYPDAVPALVKRIPFSRKLQGWLFGLINTFPLYEWIWARHIRNFIRSFQPDALHVHDLYMSRAAFLAVRSLKKQIPIVLDLHEHFPEAIKTFDWNRGFWRQLLTRPGRWAAKEGRYLKYASRIIALSGSFREDLLARHRFLDPAKVFVAPNVPDLETMESYPVRDLSSLTSSLQTPVFFYFGVIAARRGIFRIFEVFKQYLSKGYQGSLLLIGPVDKSDRVRFQEFLDDPMIQPRLVYIPWIDLSELPSYMALADVCLAPFSKDPQHESGIANKIYQYMYGGKALLVSDCKPQEELVNAYSCGLSFANDTEFLHTMIWMTEHPEERKQMGKNGYKAVSEKLNADSIREELAAAFQ